MSVLINYQKRKNSLLFKQFQTNKNSRLAKIQNYNPIFKQFFSLNETNWNCINLNNTWNLTEIKNNKKLKNDSETHFKCKLTHISDDEQVIENHNVFMKMAPLLDPYKYLVGKYDNNNPDLFSLPSFIKKEKIHPKIDDPNNSSYIDGFFSFLISRVLHEHRFIHGIDYYGSFLAIKNDFKVNIIDDIDYLIESEFFNKHQNEFFKIDDYSHLIFNNNTKAKNLMPLKITDSFKNDLLVPALDDSIFENIFETTNENIINLHDLSNTSLEVVDITGSFEFNTEKDVLNNNSIKSGSTCSSRTSHTSEETTDLVNGLPSASTDNGSEQFSVSDSSSIDGEEVIMATFPKFPVHVICMEKCENTFDELIANDEIGEDEWFAALFQIIMILISYQKMFSFTHNDLHTNNVMWTHTKQQFIYYVYKKKTYKVPTFGKIYKIIDFGRAIYKFDGKVFCSDSFQPGGDAATQYNTEPYFNDNKPRIEPNYSFDLCRLACSIFDYVVDDFETIKTLTNCSPIVRLIVEWCIDDNGINVLYKNNGDERYPDFKLYKMIARCVHNHTPQAQLERDEFNRFLISGKNLQKTDIVTNIDDLPCYV